jgi:hypothetical protein
MCAMMNPRRINQLVADNNYRLKQKHIDPATTKQVFFMTQHNDEEKLAQFRRETALRRKKQQDAIRKKEQQEQNRAKNALNERKNFITQNAVKPTRVRRDSKADSTYEDSKNYFKESKQRLQRKEEENSFEYNQDDYNWMTSARTMESLDLQSSVHDSTKLFMIAENLANRDDLKASRLVSMLIAQGSHKRRKANSVTNRSATSTPSPPSPRSVTSSPCSTPSPPSTPLAENEMYKANSRIPSRSGPNEKPDFKLEYDFKLVIPEEQKVEPRKRLVRGKSFGNTLTVPEQKPAPVVPKQPPGVYRRPWREKNQSENGIEKPKRRQYKVIETGFSTDISNLEKSVARIDKMLKANSGNNSRNESALSNYSYATTNSNTTYNSNATGYYPMNNTTTTTIDPLSDFKVRQQRIDEVIENPSSVHHMINNFENQMQHMRLKEELEQQPQQFFPNGDPSSKKKLRIPIFRSKPIAINEGAVLKATPREPVQQIAVQQPKPIQLRPQPMQQTQHIPIPQQPIHELVQPRVTSRETRIPRFK